MTLEAGTKLGREVAIKLLLEEVSQDAERLARFEREARVLASLNHPNIASLHSFERDGDTSFLVMELVEGETLADRIKRGAIPIDEALPLFLQIAEGLEAAHEKGVIHRDLKPANIKVTDDGQVKILDFGLAKAMAPAGVSEMDPSESPTLTLAGHDRTRQGQILGTAAYMSPEQAKGERVDRRADVWAFGACLFEALTGHRCFQGQTAAETIAGVLEREPDWRRLPAPTPPSVRRLLRRCLTRTTRDRLRDIADARLDLVETDESRDSPEVLQRSRVPLFVAVMSAAVAIGALVWNVSSRTVATSSLPRSPEVIRSSIALPEEAPLVVGVVRPVYGFDNPLLAISQDGARLVYVGTGPEGTLLYQRSLDDFEVRPIEGTDGAIHPFFSPGGEWLGFLTNGQVKKVPLSGGAPLAVSAARAPSRATWTADGWIIFSEDEGRGLARVRSDGGDPEEIETDGVCRRGKHVSEVSSDGKIALFSCLRGVSADNGSVVALSLETFETRTLVESGYDGRLSPSGHLLFVRSGDLYAVAIDLKGLRAIGSPTRVLRGVRTESLFGNAQYALSADGTLVFLSGGEVGIGQPVWVDRAGNVEPIAAPPDLYGVFELSPDASQLAIQVAGVEDFVAILDLQSGTRRRLQGEGARGFPFWSPDGRQLAISSWNDEHGWIEIQSAVGAEPPAKLRSERRHRSFPIGWLFDGHLVVNYGLESVETFDPSEGVESAVVHDIAVGTAEVSPDGLARLPDPRPGRDKPDLARLLPRLGDSSTGLF